MLNTKTMFTFKEDKMDLVLLEKWTMLTVLHNLKR